ncbi:class I SAM-dependent methyltransferase [Actinomadura rudentiformis]|uniref:Class I SAM-dependent methyltransferase n=1 Tax=Actinomadura rudentiformis TaxID=359158 RepID=A0A6H9YIY9_9ACTN|nr:class I SAM-dependent methyltransferase [Actinomadura rudentiformis]KAB2346045.1 class I SAM-dependent methyltransferase [Actinomadura rudentiformis]
MDAERYDRTRPSYPAVLVERIVAASPGRNVLDVGSGTGISARQFQAAGCRVLGVDPDQRMAELARQSGVESEVSTFEEWDPAGRTFDAVVAGQAWHWVDPVAGANKAAQVLRPGGRLTVFWNVGDPQAELADAFSAVYARVMPEMPAYRASDGYSAILAKVADRIREAGAFSEPEQWRFDWERAYERDEWLDQLPTQGFHTRLPQAKLREILEGVGAAIDAAGGSFTMHYTAVVVTATRTD